MYINAAKTSELVFNQIYLINQDQHHMQMMQFIIIV